MRRARLPAFAILVAQALLLASCGEPFEPFEDRALGFSIFGVLDATADTQWIRVTAVRNSVLTQAEPPSPTVTLEHLGTGQVTLLRDSVFTFPATHLDPGNQLYAQNFWTDTPIEPGETYRLSATGAGGPSSTVEVLVPPDADTIVVGVPQGASGVFGYLRTVGVEYLATVHVFPDCLGTGFSYQGGGPDVRADEGGRIDMTLRLACASGDTIRARGVRIVLSGTPWPYDPSWNEVTTFLPDIASNVEDGLGFLGGVLTRTIRFDTCHVVTSGTAEYCEVVYTGGQSPPEDVEEGPPRDLPAGPAASLGGNRGSTE